MRSLLLVFATLIVFVVSPSYAQEGSDTLSFELPPIPLKAARLLLSAADAPWSFSSKRLDPAFLNASSSTNLDHILFAQPAVLVADRQNYSQGERLIIRGSGWQSNFGVRGIMVIQDGLPLTLPDGQTVLNTIDPSLIKHIEVLQGPSAFLWGNSSGGVIYLESFPSPSNPNIRFRTFGGSFNTQKYEAELTLPVGQDILQLYGTHFRTDGYRAYSRHETSRIGLRHHRTLSPDAKLTTTVVYNSAPIAENPGALTLDEFRINPAQADPIQLLRKTGKANQQVQAGTTYEHKTWIGDIQLMSSYQYRAMDNPLAFAVVTLNRHVTQQRFSLTRSDFGVKTSIGTDFGSQWDNRSNFQNSNGVRGDRIFQQDDFVQSLGTFLVSSSTFGRFHVTGGLRYDHQSVVFRHRTPIENLPTTRTRYFDNLSAGFGLSYATEHHLLFANVSNSYEVPTTTELVNQPDGSVGINRTLLPERKVGMELGTRSVLSDDVALNFTVFGALISDRLVSFTAQNNRNYFENADKIRQVGVEMYTRWQAASSLTIEHSYSWNSFTFLDEVLNGNMLPGMPEHRFQTRVSYQYGRLYSSVDYRWHSHTFINNANSIRADAYHLIDLRISSPNAIGKGWMRGTPFIAVNNVLDTRYVSSVVVNAANSRFFEAGASRNWMAGISFQLL